MQTQTEISNLLAPATATTISSGANSTHSDSDIFGKSQPQTSVKHQFDALTSLRFFACAAIVFLHSAWFFIDIDFMKKWQLDEGVAFFFVLSGFILAYVYPDLRGVDNIKRFLANRLGRMVPSHIFLTFVALAVLPCSCANASVFFANLFLIQSWMPRREYYFSLNAVSWSICAEIFFSIAFLFLIRPWRAGWTGKIILGFLITVIACIAAHLFESSGNHGFFKLNEEYLLKINPLVRTFDFIVGMFTAKLWMRYSRSIKLSTAIATLMELVLITIILFEITQITSLIEQFIPALKHYPSVIYWLTHGGCSPIFAMLIFVMALETGYVSKLLANPILVWLGEISYSIYMVHFIIIQCLNFYLPEFGKLSWPLTYSIYLAIVVLISCLNFNLIETPIRKIIRSIVSSPGKYQFSLTELWQNFRPNRGQSILAAILTITLTTASGAYVTISQSRFHYTNLHIDKRIDFEDYFRLEKIAMASADDGSKINLTWHSLKTQTVDRLIEITCIDKKGNMVALYEKKDMFPLKLKQGKSWSQTIYMPSNADKRSNWDKLGIRLSMRVEDINHHHLSRILAPRGGSIDWWGTRLTIPLNKQVLSPVNSPI